MILRRVWEPVRLFIGRKKRLLNIVSFVVGGLLWCWYVVDLWVTGAVGGGAPCVYEAVTKDEAGGTGGCVKGEGDCN